MAEVVGSISVVASINTKDYDAGKKHIEKGNNELEDNAKKTSSGFSAAWAGAIGGLVATVAQKGFATISSSIDSAVKRVDTLNNSTRTFENMGIATTDSKKAMDALQKSIKGLPTPLDGAVRGMTALTATYGNIDRGQKVFSALNNAILGFGGSAAEVDNAITQLSQRPMDGPLDAQTWNSLLQSGLTPVINAMAKDMGKSVGELKEAFGSGELTVQDFTDRLVKMNTDGGGGLKSLEKIAKDSTGGISTGFENMQTSIVRGMGEIISSIGSTRISNAISSIGTMMEKSLTVASSAIKSLIQVLSENKTAVVVLASAVAAATVGWKAYQLTVVAVTAIKAAVTAASVALSTVLAIQAQGVGILRAAWIALNLVMKANPMGLVIAAVAALAGGLAALTGMTNNNKSATDRLTEARRQAKLATDNLKTAEDSLAGAQLSAQTAALSVERAQLNYNNAVAQYGPKSLEAREAANQLKSAEYQLRDANNAVKDATNKKSAAEAENAKKQQEVKVAEQNKQKAISITNRRIQTQTNNLDILTGRLNGLNGKVFSYTIREAQQVVNDGVSSPEAKAKARDTIKRYRGFSTGGFTGRGGEYEPAGIVHKGEYVVPKQYVNQSTGLPNVGGKTEYNIQNINISSEVDGDRWLRRLTNNTEIESSGLVPTQRYA